MTGAGDDGSAEARGRIQAAMIQLIANVVLYNHVVAQRVGLGASDGQFMTLLNIHGPLTPGELARKVFRSEANLTTVLDNLERDGLIARVPRPEDRRSRTIQLTGEGRALTESVFPDHAARIARVMGALSADEQTQLAALCRKLGIAAAG